MVLTQKQRHDMHVGMLEYMHSQGVQFAEAASVFADAAGLEPAVGSNTGTDGKGLLEKKWTSVVRLQRKVMDLEARLEQAQEDLRSGSRPGKDSRLGGADRVLPRAPAKAVLSGHRNPITCVALHPLYSVVASASEDATIKVWDYETGECERTLKGHTNVVQGVSFSPDGQALASCGADTSIKEEIPFMYGILGGNLLAKFNPSVDFNEWVSHGLACFIHAVEQPCFHEQIWDFSDGGASIAGCLRTLRGHDHNVSCVAWVPPSGDTLVSCSRDHTIKFWEVATGFCTRTLTGHTEWVRRVALSDDGEVLASCGNDQVVKVWNVQAGHCLHDLREHTHVVEAIAFAPESANRSIATTSVVAGAPRGSGVSASALPDGAAALPLPPDGVPNGTVGDGFVAGAEGGGHEGAFAGAAGAGTAGVGWRFLASGSRDKTVKLWNATVGQCLMTFSFHENWVRSVIIHPSGAFILSSSDDRSVRAFDLKTGRCARTLEDAHGHFVTSLAMHKTSPIVVTGGVDREIHVWECR